MANLTEVPGLVSVVQLESNDDVQGGAGGKANQQAQELLNNIRILDKGMYGTKALLEITADLTITSAHAGQLIRLTASAGSDFKTITLPNISSFPDGGLIVFDNLAGATKQLKIDFAANGSTGDWHGNSLNTMWVVYRDIVVICKPIGGIHYYVLQCSLDRVGEIVLKPNAMATPPLHGYLLCDGSTYDPLHYPRLNDIALNYGIGTNQLPLLAPLDGSAGVGSQDVSYYVKY